MSLRNAITYKYQKFIEADRSTRVLLAYRFLFRYPRRVAAILFTVLVGLPLVLLVRAIRPLAWIRFGSIRSDVIGHALFNVECYCSERELTKSKTWDFFYFETTLQPNEQWALMVRRNLRVHPLVQYFDRVNQKLPGSHRHHARQYPEGISKYDYGKKNNAIKRRMLRTNGPHLRFSEEENIRGWQFLKEIGLQKKDLFVCLIVRDSAYKERYQKWSREWSYQDYRDSDIGCYEQAALALADKGYWVFRMGKAVHKPFLAGHHRILDYANSHYRNDFLDLWLSAHCHFMVSSGTGLDTMAFLYRRPLVLVNHLMLYGKDTNWKTIYVPKYLIWKSNNTPLTLREHLDLRFLATDEFERAGISIRDLKPMEIQGAVLEMESRLAGTWEDTPEDIELQAKFREVFQAWPEFREYHEKISPESRIGAAFLRQNRQFLQ